MKKSKTNELEQEILDNVAHVKSLVAQIDKLKKQNSELKQQLNITKTLLQMSEANERAYEVLYNSTKSKRA